MQLRNDLLSSLKLPATFISHYALAFLILSLYACANWPHFACVSSCVWGQRMVIFQSTGRTCISIADKAELLIFFLEWLEKGGSLAFQFKYYVYIVVFSDFLKSVPKFWMKCGEMRTRRCLSYLQAVAVGSQDYPLCTVILRNDFPRQADGFAERWL